jgi:tRNA-2-methylthio-N6-dimethylallyladenosine synthase
MKNQEVAKKKVLIRTFGCQMNVRDSEFVAGLLLKSGFALAGSIADADIIIFNSCSVRGHAEERLFNNIWQLKKAKLKNPELVIGVMGCTAQSYKQKLIEMIPLIDFVCGPGNEGDLPEIVKDVLKNRCAMIAVDKVNEKRPEIDPEYRDSKPKAFVSIGEGCNNFCSYCIVPYVRGRERSRDEKDIVKEVKSLARRGFTEITLLGQNVNSYGKVGSRQSAVHSFVKLLEKLNKIKGIKLIRFMTSHPKDASAELFKAIGSLDKVDKRLHLPIQSGSDRILKLMNRGYTRKKYMELVGAFKRLVPGGSITTDIIVGFPTETRKDFNGTLNVIKKCGFESAFIFKYSPRPPAKAHLLKDDVSKKEKEKRHEEALRAIKSFGKSSGLYAERSRSIKKGIA